MSIKEELDLLEKKMTRLKVDYEQYFMRILKREPIMQRDEIDSYIRRHSNQPIRNTSFKFKFESLVARYNSYKQYWNRILRSIEEGTYVRRAEGFTTSIKDDLPPLIDSLEPIEEAAPAPKANGGGMREVYDSYIDARKKCSESVKGISFEGLQKKIDSEKKKVAAKYGTSDLDLKVHVKDGKASISIKPKK